MMIHVGLLVVEKNRRLWEICWWVVVGFVWWLVVDSGWHMGRHAGKVGLLVFGPWI